VTGTDPNPLVNALLDVLTRALPPTITVCDAEVPGDVTYPYVVVYPDPGMVSAPTADGAFVDVLLKFQVTAVGITRAEALGAAKFARDAVIGVELPVAGRSNWPIEQDLAVPVTRDDTARAADNAPVFIAVCQYSFLSVPA
jgi:hypothetical protein